PGRVLLLELGKDSHAGSRRHARQLHQRRVADRRQRGAARCLQAAHLAPPAIAGSTITVASAATVVSRPSPRRTSSLFTYTFTNRFRSPESSSRCPLIAG